MRFLLKRLIVPAFPVLLRKLAIRRAGSGERTRTTVTVHLIQGLSLRMLAIKNDMIVAILKVAGLGRFSFTS
jgi:hypothetical protein